MPMHSECFLIKFLGLMVCMVYGMVLAPQYGVAGYNGWQQIICLLGNHQRGHALSVHFLVFHVMSFHAARSFHDWTNWLFGFENL